MASLAMICSGNRIVTEVSRSFRPNGSGMLMRTKESCLFRADSEFLDCLPMRCTLYV